MWTWDEATPGSGIQQEQGQGFREDPDCMQTTLWIPGRSQVGGGGAKKEHVSPGDRSGG